MPESYQVDDKLTSADPGDSPVDANTAPPSDFPVSAVNAGFRLCHTGRLRLWAARAAWDLLDDPRYVAEFHARNELMPYWADLWTCSRLVSVLLDSGAIPLPDSGPVLELGAGLGAPGLTMAKRGYETVLTDLATDALNILAIHRRENLTDDHGPCRVQRLDFTNPPSRPDRCFPFILGADILYEKRFAAPLVKTLAAFLSERGRAIIADPCRPDADAFRDRLAKTGWTWDQETYGRDALSETYGINSPSAIRIFHIKRGRR